MSSELQLISDGDGLAVIGKATDIERFILAQGLGRAPSRELDLSRLGPLLGAAGAVAQAGSDVAENSGRWVKLAKDSANLLRQYGATTNEKTGVVYAMIGKIGKSQKWLKLDPSMASRAGSLLGGPMALSALSTMMQQRAMQQQIDEIVDYLEAISEKVDDILRNQNDAVLAPMIGVDLIIEEALAVSDQVGHVSDITWSKVQSSSHTIASTQVYALRQLDAVSEKLAQKANIGQIADAINEAGPKIQEWLAVLAHCYRLQEGVSVIELERVLDASPEDLDKHRRGLTLARQNRLDLIARSTVHLLEQMEETAREANSKVLLNPRDAPSAVRASNQITAEVLGFRERLGLESGQQIADAKRWIEAVTETRDKVVAAGTEGFGAVRRFGTETLPQATEVFRAVDIDGDGVPDKPRAAAALEDAGVAIRETAAGAVHAVGAGVSDASSAMRGLAAGVAGAVGSKLKRTPKIVDTE